MKYVSAIVILLVSAVMLFASNNKAPVATTNVVGIVIDNTTGEALAGVKIHLDENTVLYSDLEGVFEIKNVSTGNHNITTDLISYSKENLNIDINKNNNKIKILLKSN